MAQIVFETYDQVRHGNPMWYVDDAQSERHWRARTIVPYKVCLVTVCGFRFIFHSVAQLKACLDYYTREHQPTSRLPMHLADHPQDHWEAQRWFEKLPQFLLERPKRRKVVAALKKALLEYVLVPGASTGTEVQPSDPS